jgi:protein MAK11
VQSHLDRNFTTVACTASSDGKIHVYDLASLPSHSSPSTIQINPVAQYDSKGSRLTCLATAEGEASDGSAAIGKRKRSEDGDGGSDDNGENKEDKAEEDAWDSNVEGDEEQDSAGSEDES